MIALLWLGCAAREAPAPSPAAPPGEFVLLHTNDLHTWFLPSRADWLPGEPEIGGFRAISGLVEAERGAWGPDAVLLLDAGDTQTGTLLGEIEVDGARGGAMMELMGATGYDAWTLGNHDFDDGLDNLQALVAASRPAVLSANVGAPGGGPALAGQQPAVVIERAGVRVGVIGATTEGLPWLTSSETMARIDLRPVVEAVGEQVERLDPETDLLVALTHLGVEADRVLAEEVPELDLIVGGHSHTRMDAAEQVGDTWIVQAGCYARSVGRGRLRVAGDALADFRWERVDLLPDRVPGPPAREVARLVDDYEARVRAVGEEVVGESTVALSRDHHHESTMGDWITDVLREATGADVALYNAGGLRADLDAGPVTRGELFAVLPFSNRVAVVELTGSDLLGVLLQVAEADRTAERGTMQLSGVRLRWRERLGAVEIVEALVGGEPLDPGRTYTAATNSYVVEHAARYLAGATPRSVRLLEQTVFEAALEALSRGPIQAPAGGRVARAE